MSDRNDAGELRKGLDWEIAFGFLEVVNERQKRLLPEVAGRWPMQSIRIATFLRDELLVVTAEPVPVPATPEVAGDPKALAQEVYDYWRGDTFDGPTFKSLVLNSHGGDARAGFVLPVRVPIPLRNSSLDEVVASWNERDKSIWDTAVSNAFGALLVKLLESPPPVVTPPTPTAPIRNPRFAVGHPSFPQPDNQGISVWRYMSLGKLASLLSTRTLHFARGDVLGDNWEGALGARNRAYMHSEGLPVDHDNPFPFAFPEPRPEMFISCWHAQEHESAAMWAAYAGQVTGTYGVALRTTYANLIESIEGERNFYAGQVRYLDYHEEFVSTVNAFDRWMAKRVSFAFENEVRLIVDEAAQPNIDGLSVPLSLAKLHAEVRVSPTAPTWFRDAVQAVVDAFKMGVQVSQSDLDAAPLR